MSADRDRAQASEFSAIGDRLNDVGKRLGVASLSGPQPVTLLEEALAEKVWNALGGRADRLERFLAALQKRVR